MLVKNANKDHVSCRRTSTGHTVFVLHQVVKETSYRIIKSELRGTLDVMWHNFFLPISFSV